MLKLFDEKKNSFWLQYYCFSIMIMVLNKLL
ncbi:MAG: hypothetical protein JWQ23_2553 [Herminiimonas sp.]|nr:hypothetical protein [Herminiimonas sp.]